MAKKKTRVLLPGGIQGLVHDLQNGTSNFAQKPLVDETIVPDDDDQEPEIEVENAALATPAPAAQQSTAAAQPAPQSAQPERQQPAPETKVASAPDNQSVRDHLVQPVSSPQAPVATNREDVKIEVTPVDQPSQPAPAPQVEPDDDTHARGRRPKENTMKEYHIVKDDSTDSWQLFIDMAKQYKSGGGKLATIYIDESLKSVLDRMKYAGPDKLSTSAILSSIVARFIYDHEDDIKKALFSGNLL